ncbi:uncharacterized protein BJ212DRAFT_1414269 [Suillus subaureus]|uniref:Hydrophobin n=1 Tax=Suillus subaureus TaxID=48587 RepID=A0A9P7APS9_9AGAM|nr:uncharacterized protein BJ212DRAFT_1414269 [Suillus subaureus]KAG1793816.1 hypothetical protein BJ212DRAFT_1414269 [Suillus subaureus]
MTHSLLLLLSCIILFVLGAPTLAPSASGGNVSATVAGKVTISIIHQLLQSSASASTSGASTTGVIAVPLSSYSFAPYPTPTLSPLPPVYPATDPLPLALIYKSCPILRLCGLLPTKKPRTL